MTTEKGSEVGSRVPPTPRRGILPAAMLRRRLFTVCSALSLLLCAAVCVLWVRSYRVADAASWQSARTACGLLSRRGQVAVSVSRKTSAAPSAEWTPHGPRLESQPVTSPRGLTTHRSGFFALPGRTLRGDDWTATNVYLILPDWFVAAALALPPALALARLARRGRRTARGLCPRCGYDLRASSDRCPECGTVRRFTP